MAPVIAIPYGSRLLTMTPPQVKADGLAEVLTTRVGPRGATDKWSYPDYIDLAAADTGMTLTGWASGRATVQTPAGEDGKPNSAQPKVKTDSPALFVSSNYFKTFGVALSRGAGFDDPQKAEPVVILAHTFWKNRLGSDPDILGKTLTLDGVPHTVV